MSKGFYFGAGPAMLPEPILKQAQHDILEWQNSGLSILELGHRTEAFRDLLDSAEASLRRLLKVPDNYHILFLTGPARMLFGMIPLNFLAEGQTAGYLVTGIWSKMAYEEAQKLKSVECMASSEAAQFLKIPESHARQINPDWAYCYYTPNETVNGIYCPRPSLPQQIPVIADMTSCLLAEPIRVEDYALIFAGAQKNIANAGMTVVIVRDDFVQTIQAESLATIMDLRTHIQHRSLYATPATFNCYLAGQMFAWIEAQGGVEAMFVINQHKARRLYDYIDQSSFYSSPIEKRDRSFLNVCFHLPDPTLEESFIQQANQRGLLGLRGHRMVGGLRASIYNAMPIEVVDCLSDFMRYFEKNWRKQR